MRDTLPQTSVSGLKQQTSVLQGRAPTPRPIFELPLLVVPGQTAAPQKALRVLPEEMFPVQPANEPTNGPAFHTADTPPVFREQVNLTLSSSQGPSPTGAGGKIAESTGGAAPFVHHRTVGRAHEVEPVRCEKPNGALNGLGGMHLERDFNMPANGTIGFEHGHLKAGTDQNAALGWGQCGDP